MRNNKLPPQYLMQVIFCLNIKYKDMQKIRKQIRTIVLHNIHKQVSKAVTYFTDSFSVMFHVMYTSFSGFSESPEP